MKQIVYITTILCMLLACGPREEYKGTLLKAEELMDDHPDSALHMLEQLRDTMQNAGKADRMYYELLSIKASDKADLLKPDADMILSIVDHYEKVGDKSLLPTAYYYAGRNYYELHDAPQALAYFQKAAEELKDNPHPSLATCIYSNLGYIFMYQGLYEEAGNAFKEEYQFALQIPDTLSMIYGLRDLSVAIEAKDNHKEALSLLKEALSLAKNSNNKFMVNRITLSLANQFKYMNDYDSAMIYAQRVAADILPPDSSPVYSTLASIFKRMHQEDSMLFYSKLMERVGNVYAKDSAYKYQTRAYLNKGDIQSARNSFQQYLYYDDSVRQITQTEAIAKARSLYDYQSHEKEKLVLQHHNKVKKITIYFTISIALLVLSSLLLYIFTSKRKHQEKVLRYQRALLFKDDVLAKSEKTIESNKSAISSLEQRICQFKNENERNSEELESQKALSADLAKELEREKERLLSSVAIAEIGIKERKKAEEAIMSSPVYRVFQDMSTSSSKIRIDEKDWIDLEKLVNREYDRFSDKLKSLGRLSESEYRLSLLIKIRIKPIEISKLLNTSKGNVSMMRSRLYKRFFGKEGPTDKWDEFIWNL